MTAPQVGPLGQRIVASMAQLVTVLTEEAGLAATFDAGLVEVPGVWLQSQSVNVRTLDGGSVHRVWAYLVAPDTGTADAHTRLGELLSKLLGVIDPDAEVTTNQAVVLPHNPTPLPSYRVVIDLDI